MCTLFDIVKAFLGKRAFRDQALPPPSYPNLAGSVMEMVGVF